jgi:hypothetical protein
MPNAGEYRNRMVLLSSSGAPDHPGFYWCAFKTLRGERFFAAYLTLGKVTAEIKCRYFKYGPPGLEIEPYIGQRLKIDNSREYTIKEVINVDGRNEEFRIIVEG